MVEEKVIMIEDIRVERWVVCIGGAGWGKFIRKDKWFI